MRIVLTVLISVFLSLNLSAQNKSTGMLYYVIDVEAAIDSLEIKQAVGLMRNSSMKLYFAPNKSRMDFILGQMSKNSVIVNEEVDSALVIISNPKTPSAYTASLSELQSFQGKEPKSMVELVDERKVILGYTCKKAIVTTLGQKTTYWYTEELDLNLVGQSIKKVGVPGFPLQFSKVSNGVLMNYQLANIEWGLTPFQLATLFNIVIPTGFVNARAQ